MAGQREHHMDVATVDHLLTTTRSVRKRLDLTRPVEADVIQQCLEIAIQAPRFKPRKEGISPGVTSLSSLIRRNGLSWRNSTIGGYSRSTSHSSWTRYARRDTTMWLPGSTSLSISTRCRCISFPVSPIWRGSIGLVQMPVRRRCTHASCPRHGR